MGISIENDPPCIDYPYPVRVTLQCDAPAGLLCVGGTRYMHEGGFVGCHSMAMNDGWLERSTDKGRIWICPECSGKAGR